MFLRRIWFCLSSLSLQCFSVSEITWNYPKWTSTDFGKWYGADFFFTKVVWVIIIFSQNQVHLLSQSQLSEVIIALPRKQSSLPVFSLPEKLKCYLWLDNLYCSLFSHQVSIFISPVYFSHNGEAGDGVARRQESYVSAESELPGVSHVPNELHSAICGLCCPGDKGLSETRGRETAGSKE